MQRIEIIEYAKNILLKVSFNKSLFEKELLKTRQVLLPEEMIEFRNWCYTTFSNEYLDVIEKLFNNF